MTTKFKIVILFILLGNSIAAQRNATIENVWHEKDVSSGGKKGMMIHAKVSVYGMRGEEIQCITSFYNSNMEKLKTDYSGNKTTENNLCAYDTDTPPYDNTLYSDFTLFVPYEAMNLPLGENTYYYRWYVRDSNSNILASSDLNSFKSRGRYTIYLPDGTIWEHTESEDGSIYCVSKTKCFFCKGTKRCNRCHGSGTLMLGYGRGAQFIRCGYCGQTGICNKCDKNGMTTSYSVTNPSGYYEKWNPRYGYYNNGFIDDKETETETETETDKPSSNKDQRHCLYCDDIRWVLEYVPSTMSDEFYCVYCNKTHFGKHIRVKCRYCLDIR